MLSLSHPPGYWGEEVVGGRGEAEVPRGTRVNEDCPLIFI